MVIEKHNKHAQYAAEKRGGTAKTLRFFVYSWRWRSISERVSVLIKCKPVASIIFLFLVAGCSTLEEPREIRNVGGIDKTAIVLAIREGFVSKGYRVETISLADGSIKVVSPELNRDLLWVIPWRKDRWTIAAYVAPLKNDDGYKITANADPEERGVLDSSVWKPRGQLSHDRNYILDLVQYIENVLIENGATLK